MVQDWVLWVPVIAAGIGAAIGAAASIATAMVSNRMRSRREIDTSRHAEIDAAERALKEIGKEVVDQILSPGWWPSFRMPRPARDFAYDVARLVPDEVAVGAWADAWQEAVKANTSPWRVWLWKLLRVGASRRGLLIDGLLVAEIAMVAAAEEMRPSREKSRRNADREPQAAEAGRAPPTESTR